MGGGLRPPKPPWVRIISFSFVNLEDVWSCCVCLEHAILPDADGNIASATKLYYKAILNKYSI